MKSFYALTLEFAGEHPIVFTLGMIIIGSTLIDIFKAIFKR